MRAPSPRSSCWRQQTPLPPEPEDSAWLTDFLPDGGPCRTDRLLGFCGPLRGLLLDPVHLLSSLLYLLFTPGNVPAFLSENLQLFLASGKTFCQFYKPPITVHFLALVLEADCAGVGRGAQVWPFCFRLEVWCMGIYLEPAGSHCGSQGLGPPSLGPPSLGPVCVGPRGQALGQHRVRELTHILICLCPVSCYVDVIHGTGGVHG